MSYTKACYETCISKKFLLPKSLQKQTQEILPEIELKAKTGRPGIEFLRGLSGIYYVLKAGIQWKALPRCFGSSSAVHRLFQKLVKNNFFAKLWHLEIKNYDKACGLKLEKQAMDGAHKKSPLAGTEKAGISL